MEARVRVSGQGLLRIRKSRVDVVVEGLALIDHSLLVGWHDVLGQTTKVSWQSTVGFFFLMVTLLLIVCFWTLISLDHLCNRWLFLNIGVNVFAFQRSQIDHLPAVNRPILHRGVFKLLLLVAVIVNSMLLWLKRTSSGNGLEAVLFLYSIEIILSKALRSRLFDSKQAIQLFVKGLNLLHSPVQHVTLLCVRWFALFFSTHPLGSVRL